MSHLPYEVFSDNLSIKGINLWARVIRWMQSRSVLGEDREPQELLDYYYFLIYCYLYGVIETHPRGTKAMISGKAGFVDKALTFIENTKIIEFKTGREFHSNIKNLASIDRLKIIFDVATSCAIGCAKWLNEMHPTAIRLAPAWRFKRLHHYGAIPLTHMINENVVRLKTDFDFWVNHMNSFDIGGFGVPWAPFDFNLCMILEPVSLKECKRLGLVKPGDKLKKPDTSRFGFDIQKYYDYSNRGVKK